jgi:hypothetical protein
VDWKNTDLVVLDGSSDEYFIQVEHKLRNFLTNSSIRLVHDPDPNSFVKRLSEGGRLAKTPYVLLAADDDLYAFGWLDGAIHSLDSDPNLGVVYGNILKFSTVEDQAFAPIKEVFLAQYKNPTLAFLEDDLLADRLESLSRDTWATAGWYAIQRKCIFDKIIQYSIEYELEPHLFERLLIFIQAASYKTRKIPDIHLCRQFFENGGHEALSYKDNIYSLGRFEKCLVSFLVRELDFEVARACELVRSTLAKEHGAYKLFDRKKPIRSLARWFPILRKIADSIRQKFNFHRASFDARIDLSPHNNDMKACIEMIKKSVD